MERSMMLQFLDLDSEQEIIQLHSVYKWFMFQIKFKSQTNETPNPELTI